MPPTVKRRTSGVFGRERAVEHHFRAAVQSGQRQRRRLQCGVGGFVRLGRRLGEVPGAEVRSQADVGDATGHLLLHDLDRLGHGAGAVVHRQAADGSGDRSRGGGPVPKQRRGERAKPLGRLLGLGQESQGHEGVRREQVERHRSIAGAGQHPVEGSTAGGGQGFGRCSAGAGMGQHALAQGVRRAGRLPLQPGSRQAPFPSARVPPPSQAETSSRVAARAWGSLVASPAPAEAKWGRPPPRPPLSAAMRFTRSPALRPARTRSSVRATWMPPRPPVLKSTSTPFRLPSRN